MVRQMNTHYLVGLSEADNRFFRLVIRIQTVMSFELLITNRGNYCTCTTSEGKLIKKM